MHMAKKATEPSGEVNKSQAIRELLKEQPKINGAEAVAALAAKGVDIKVGLFYLVKGNALGRKTRRKKREAKAVDVVETKSTKTPTSHGDAVATILKVKMFAKEIGSLGALKELI